MACVATPRRVGNLPTGWIFGFWGRFGALFVLISGVEITSLFYQKLYVERVEKRALISLIHMHIEWRKYGNVRSNLRLLRYKNRK